MSDPVVERDTFVARVRLRHILMCLSAVHYGAPLSPFAFREKGKSGHYFESNGEGDHQVVAWNAKGVVALMFDHESPESEYSLPIAERRVDQHLPELPTALAEP